MGTRTLVNSVKVRLWQKNQNWLCIITGPTGTGKSYAALSLGEEIQGRKLEVHQVVFTAREFLEELGNLKKGDVIIFDEAGIGMSAREWSSQLNKMLSTVLQSFRYRNIAVIFTVPDLSFVDVHLRKLFHTLIETKLIFRRKELCVAGWFQISYNGRVKKTYYFHPKVRNYDSTWAEAEIYIRKPRATLIDHYEEKKQAYAEKLRLTAIDKMTERKAPGADLQIEKERIKELFFSLRKDGLSIKEAAKQTNVKISTAKNWDYAHSYSS